MRGGFSRYGKLFITGIMKRYYLWKEMSLQLTVAAVVVSFLSIIPQNRLNK